MEKPKFVGFRRKIAPATLRRHVVRKKLEFFASERDLAPILAALGRSRMLLAAFLACRGALGDPNGRSQGSPGALRGAPETAPGRPWPPRGVPKGPRDDFRLIWGATGPLPRPILKHV